MTWTEYETAFRDEAKKNKKSEAYVFRCLAYAKPLFCGRLPVIYDVKHLSLLLGLKAQYVFYLSNCPSRYYRKFKIRKKCGGERTIEEPLPDLKDVQKWILTNILNKLDVSPYAKAFRRGHSIKDNARFHRKQKTVLSVDIINFFPSISQTSVFRVFRNAGYNNGVATILAKLCCLNNRLPQGAPSSPLLSNLVFHKIDDSVSKYARANELRYTRYADDLTLSGDVNVSECMYLLSMLLYKEGFSINSRKTRVARQNARQEVTGIVVNHFMQAPKPLRKCVRQQMYYIQKYGLDSHLYRTGERRCNYLNHLMGLVGHIIYINPRDEEMRGYMNTLITIHQSLSSDEHT